MVYLKKACYSIALIILAFLLTELVFATVIDYPKYGVLKKMHGMRKSENGISEIFYPKSKYWNVEGGNTRQERNNIGLPGKDIYISDTTNYVFILGDSYVEAYQVEPSNMASTILDNNLDSIFCNQKYEVLNLGCSGHDEYDLFLRSNYFAKEFKPTEVILVITNEFNGKMILSDNIDYYKDDDSEIYEIKKTSTEIQRIGRNNFTLVNLLALYLKKTQKTTNSELGTIANNIIKDNQYDSTNDWYFGTYNAIYNFHLKYDKFKVLVIDSNFEKLNRLREFCNKNNISFYSSYILSEENRFNNNGHLNSKGNKDLGNALTSVFCDGKK